MGLNLLLQRELNSAHFLCGDELLLFSSASILVCIASSTFVVPSIFASTLVQRALLFCRLVDKVAVC